MAVQLISRVRDVLGVDLPVGEFLRIPDDHGHGRKHRACAGSVGKNSWR